MKVNRGSFRATRIVAVCFAIGSIEHLIGLILLGFSVEMFPRYPAWRHAAFTVVDAGIAYLAYTRPHRLFIPVLAFLIEQILVNGTYAWRTWRTSGDVLWGVPAMIALISAATVVALRERLKADSQA